MLPCFRDCVRVVKLNPNVASSRRKSRKAHFGAHSEARRVLMSAGLSKDLFEKHNVRVKVNGQSNQHQIILVVFVKVLQYTPDERFPLRRLLDGG